VNTHVTDRLSLYLDGELAAEARSEVEDHLRSCAACARHLEELAAVDAAARELPVPAPPRYFDTLPARVRARLPAPRRRTPPVWMWAAAAGIVLAALAPLVFRQAVSPVPEAALTEEEPRPVAPPPTVAYGAPAEAPAAAPALDKLGAKDAVRAKAASPAGKPEPARGRAAENDSRVPAAPPPPPAPAPQVQKHNGPWAQVPQAAARSDEAGASTRVEEELPVRAPLADAPRDAAEGKVEREQREQARRGLSGSTATFAQAPTEETRYRSLLARRPASAAEDRQVHDEWRAFVASYPSSPRADEARVRALEALLSAYRREGEARDRERLREEAGLYLQRSDAAQAPRVRALLEAAALQ
jgi:Putative zinc-finger